MLLYLVYSIKIDKSIAMLCLLSQLVESDLELRTPETYDHMCSLLSTSGSNFETTTFGINQRSVLNDLSYYHVCDYGLPPDVMHDILEGYLPYTLKLMLSHFIISEKLFTLQFLNTAITNMDYSYVEASRPQLLSDSALSVINGCTSFPLSGMYYYTLWQLSLCILIFVVASET